MITDPNWLYSTIAQSSAAIVAILGGFITHSVLTLSAEKRSLKSQLFAKKSELKGLKRPLPLIREDLATPEEIQSRRELAEGTRIKVYLLEATIFGLETRLKTFSYPSHLRPAVYILPLFAFFSIILPVSFILNEVSYPVAKQVTFYFFMAGLVTVIAYIILLIKELRRK